MIELFTVLLLLLCCMFQVDSFSSSLLSNELSLITLNKSIKSSNPTKTSSKCKMSNIKSSTATSNISRMKCNRCPEPEEDNDITDLDRREALFAMLGSVWATTTGFPSATHAIYGSDAKIEIPNVIDSIEKRKNLQCLVESLGNRDCLVYIDPEKKLYQGPDSQILLSRLETAFATLNSFPDLIKSKKWSIISGKLIGPMGTLIDTMNKLAKNAPDPDKATKLSNNVKKDVFAIGAAVDKKQGDIALAKQREALEHLEEFVLSL